MKQVFTLLFFAVLVSLVNCKKSTPLSCTAFALEISDEATAWSNAASKYSSDPTPENCQAYKDAGQIYLNALRQYDNCAFTAQDQASFNASIKEAQESLDDLVC